MSALPFFPQFLTPAFPLQSSRSAFPRLSSAWTFFARPSPEWVRPARLILRNGF